MEATSGPIYFAECVGDPGNCIRMEFCECRPVWVLDEPTVSLDAASVALFAEAVRAHLQSTFEQVPPAQQKLKAQLDFSRRLVDQYTGDLQSQLTLIGRNREQTSQIQTELEAHADGMAARLSTGSADITRILQDVRQRGMRFIDTHFKVRLRQSAADNTALQQEFEQEVIGRALEQITDLSNDYVNAQVDANRRYWQGIVNRLNQLDQLLRDDIDGVDGTVYTEQRQALQEAIAIADAEMSAYSNDQMLEVMRQRFQTNLTGLGTSAGLGGLGTLAAVLALAAKGSVFAYPLTTLGFIVGAPVALVPVAPPSRWWGPSPRHRPFAVLAPPTR